MIDKLKLEKVLKQVSKPARYIGGELNSVKKDLSKVDVKFAFAFPDVYEVGMSHLGLQILYFLTNEESNYACERVFAPWEDMEKLMREENIPLFTLESKEEVKNFDFLGFTLQYELSYTNIINMLDLAGITILARERREDEPIIIAGGPCAYTPEPLVDFVDLFILGEGEEVNLELFEIYVKHKNKGFKKRDFLFEAANLEGIYVPMYYREVYKEDGTISHRETLENVPEIISKRKIDDLDNMFSPVKQIVPFIETVHDRVVMEMFRGCTHGCRFCQAGMLYRPIREKSPDKLLELAEELITNTGYDEISLSSLSSCDYTRLLLLISSIMEKYKDKKLAVSLPSLRLDSFFIDVLKEIEKVKKTGLTFAPEAGTQRLRDVINKGVTEEDLDSALSSAFKEGWSKVKLYFMMGLPTETEEDLLGIKEVAYRVKDLFFNRPKEEKKGNFQVTSSASCFVPKAFTPFQWFGQNSIDEFYKKIYLIKDEIKDPKVKFKYHDPYSSQIEAVIARGDRRTGKLLLKAWEKGCKFDGWSDFFDYENWKEAMEETDISPEFYAMRNREVTEVLPWDFIDIGVTKDYLKKEYEKSLNAQTTKDCRNSCNACGIENCAMWGVFN